MVCISRFFTVLLLAVTLGLVSSISAQGEPGSLPACSDDEMASIATTFQEFGTDFADLGERIQNSVEADLPALTAELNDFQVRWWGEVAPSIPNCSPATELSLLVGRMVDESLIALALRQAGYDDLATGHVEQITHLSEQLADAMSEINAVRPRLGRWEGRGLHGTFKFEISFRVTEVGTITNFVTHASQPGVAECTITINDIPIASDGSFTIELDSLQGDPSEWVGRFVTDTTLTGTFTSLLICGELVLIGLGEEPFTWTATWQG